MNPVSYPLPSPLPVPLPPTPTNSLLACILLLRIISLCPHGYYPLSQFLFFFFFVIQDAPCSLWCACLVFFRRFLCRWLLFLLANRFISWSLKNLPTSISNVESAWHFKIGIKFFYTSSVSRSVGGSAVSTRNKQIVCNNSLQCCELGWIRKPLRIWRK